MVSGFVVWRHWIIEAGSLQLAGFKSREVAAGAAGDGSLAVDRLPAEVIRGAGDATASTLSLPSDAAVDIRDHLTQVLRRGEVALLRKKVWPVISFSASYAGWRGSFVALNPEDNARVLTSAHAPIDPVRYESWKQSELARRVAAHEGATRESLAAHAAAQASATAAWEYDWTQVQAKWRATEAQRPLKLAAGRVMFWAAIVGFLLLLVPIIGSTVIGGEPLGGVLIAALVFAVPFAGLMFAGIKVKQANQAPAASPVQPEEPVVPYSPIAPVIPPLEYLRLPGGAQVNLVSAGQDVGAPDGIEDAA